MLSNAHVNDHDIGLPQILGFQHYIGFLNIAVHNSLSVHTCKATQTLTEDAQPPVFVIGSYTNVFSPVFETKKVATTVVRLNQIIGARVLEYLNRFTEIWQIAQLEQPVSFTSQKIHTVRRHFGFVAAFDTAERARLYVLS
jgi:hypothetical protein